MAARASRELVHHLHNALDDHRIDASRIRDAVLRADREVGRSIARHTDGAGAATVALCAGTGMLLSRWLIAWVGDCRVYRVSARREEPAQLLTVDDTYGHLSEVPPPGGSSDDPARMVGNGAVSANRTTARSPATRRSSSVPLPTACHFDGTSSSTDQRAFKSGWSKQGSARCARAGTKSA